VFFRLRTVIFLWLGRMLWKLGVRAYRRRQARARVR